MAVPQSLASSASRTRSLIARICRLDSLKLISGMSLQARRFRLYARRASP